MRLGPFHRQCFSTQIVDVRAGQLLDVVPGRGSAEPMGWLAEQGPSFRSGIGSGLDLSGPYRRVFEVPDTTLVVKVLFHLTKLASTKSTSAVAGSRTRPSVTGAGSPIPSTAVGAC